MPPPYLVGPALIVGYNVFASGVDVLGVFGGVIGLGGVGVYGGFAARRGDRGPVLALAGLGAAGAAYWWLLARLPYGTWPLIFTCWAAGLAALGGAAVVEAAKAGDGA